MPGPAPELPSPWPPTSSLTTTTINTTTTTVTPTTTVTVTPTITTTVTPVVTPDPTPEPVPQPPVVTQAPDGEVSNWDPGFPLGIRAVGAGGWPSFVVDIGANVMNIINPIIANPPVIPPPEPEPIIEDFETPELDFGENFAWN